MSNGKIIYTPPVFKSVVSTNPQNLIIDDATFNVGTGNFGIDALAIVSNIALNVLAMKVSDDWNAETGTGYAFGVITGQLFFQYATGSGITSIMTPSPVITANVPFWAKVNVNRAGNIDLYLNGSLVKSADVSAAAGSWDNTGGLSAGYSGTGSATVKLSLLRFDKGRLLPAAWITDEWTRLQYGYPRTVKDFTAMWTFGETLYDLSPNQFLLAYSGGAASYAAGWPVGPLSYSFPIGYDWGHDCQFIDTDDLSRALDGTLNLYRGARKRQFNLNFECDYIQKTVIEAAWAGGYPLKFYEDENGTGLTASICECPKVQSLFAGYYAVSLKIEEI